MEMNEGQIWLPWVLVPFCAMELTKAGILISSLTSKILSAAKLANVSTVASNSVLAGLSSMAKIASAVFGGAVAVEAVPTVLGAMGFTGAGIAASSIAAKMMSVAAISNGGGVAAGSLVATLQSVGAAGLSMSSKVLLGSAGSALVSRMVGL
ncbi:interferon alpha-inducible protein 27-like protein 2A isoform X3 [Manis javanica]|uniref:interferon alpha-inducible protein 27-like protein 2A isoform X3 n=1 Tax=Manis javanica TaxID=9974 RepID=UPI003C6D9437